MNENVDKYRDWYILSELPKGWVIDKTAGSPAPRTVFITNGKSPISGQQKESIIKSWSEFLKEYEDQDSQSKRAIQ